MKIKSSGLELFTFWSYCCWYGVNKKWKMWINRTCVTRFKLWSIFLMFEEQRNSIIKPCFVSKWLQIKIINAQLNRRIFYGWNVMILLEIFVVFVDSEGKLFLRHSCTFTWIIIENNTQLKTVFYCLISLNRVCCLFMYQYYLY